ncbi:MAG: hypothetical protein WDM76_06315 [Limisphaerales bacterium]
MKREKRIHLRLEIFAAALTFISTLCRAEDFGDISVSAQAMYSGNTSHGYAEMRVTLENHSSTKTHLVTLTFPDRAWSSGNSISRLSPLNDVGAGCTRASAFVATTASRQWRQ